MNTGEPVRNSYLRSELRNFLRTLGSMAVAVPDPEFQRGWFAALTAIAMLIGLKAEEWQR